MTAETTNHINIQDLIVSVKDLMTAETTNSKTIQDLTTRVDHLKTAETANENTIQILTAHVDHLKTAETTNNKTIPDLKARVDHLMTAETTNTKTIQDLTTRVGKLDGMSDKRKVWFAAVYGNKKTCDDKVIFDNVPTNMGNAYDANIGIFTAPYKGAYFFTLTYQSWGKKMNLDVYKEKKDGSRERLMSLYDTTYIKDKNYMASNSRMVDLEHEDKVYVYAYSDHVLTSSWSNVFSGFLLHPM
ncbi:complement C1q subcomponent subunit A-like [Dunckerocampus dactyliophorus]|uniref:complement C1q subcomponent subunit A-like n=1 Tax=Dunckerocampus dactyliophorus TaxID=161453 RepID=UPI0024075C61|nr:complement C1q subcomponent subunit A-like [Dunckerocampus dactyliophorus]